MKQVVSIDTKTGEANRYNHLCPGDKHPRPTHKGLVDFDMSLVKEGIEDFRQYPPKGMET